MKSIYLLLNTICIKSTFLESVTKEDCGYLGITETECTFRKCIWNNSTSSEPYCYNHSPRTCSVNVPAQTDCGHVGISEDECINKNCCWQPKPNQSGSFWCYNKRPRCNGYSLMNIIEKEDSISADLKINNKGCHEISVPTEYLELKVMYISNKILQIKITDSNNTRYEVPKSILNFDQNKHKLSNKDYQFEYTKNPFTFKVIRNSDKENIFDSDVNGMESLVYQNQYIELSTKMPKEANVYGMSQVIHAFRRDPKNTLQALWNIDNATPVGENVYGAHPFYLEMRNGKAHGVFMKNSNGMDMQLSDGVMTYKIIGGVIDLYIFVGDKPTQVIEQYTDIIGKPQMISYWSLGFQQCRYGYKNLNEVITVVDKFKENNLPLEVVWIDIDYLKDNKDFELDENNFPLQKMKEFVEKLHSRNQKFILILDPAIKVEKGYTAYETGLQQDIFVKNKNGEPFVGKVWPGETLFPDFFSPNATKWWTDQLVEFIKDIPIDGLWIDMNEPSSFCNGDCDPSKNEKNQLNNPPYNIYNANKRDPLNTKTLNPDIKHHGYYHYDVHNLYGIAESIVSHDAIMKIRPDIRPFVLSRSTFSGSGKYAGHWLGDNWSKWEYIYYSITGMLSSQLFGIPYVGSDICGFVGPSNEELCLRWMQVGAFYPFSRNHNAIDQPSQEPYVWKNVAEASRKALGIRYSLLPHYYTLFYYASKTGAPVMRSMLFEFPDNKDTVMIDRQFLIGDSILVAPVIEQGATSVHAYFPNDDNTFWYDYYTLENVDYKKWTDIHVDLFSIPIFIRGGKSIFTQYPGATTHESRLNKFRILVALDKSKRSAGEIYLDDGQSINSKHSLINIYTDLNDTKSNKNIVEITGTHEYIENPHLIDEIVIAGANLINIEKVKISSKSCGNRILEGKGITSNNTHVTFKMHDISLNCDWVFELM